MGLPSGTKWASCNIGADKPEDYGNYYAWWETIPKESYSESNHFEAGDAATVNWGGNWRMPTKAECAELLDNCIWTLTMQNGIIGSLVTSKTNSNFIFLPAAGGGSSAAKDAVWNGEYLSSEESSSSSLFDTSKAYRLVFSIASGDYEMKVGAASSYRGLSVRPVCSSSSSSSSSRKTSWTTLTLYADGCDSAKVIRCTAGQQININAVPKNEHRHFVRWTDGNTDNPRLVTVTKDTEFTAEFASDPNLTLISADESMGSVSGAGQFQANSSCEISAKANEFYCFSQWSDGNTDNPRTIVLTCDTTFTAEFALVTSGQCGDNLYWKYADHTLTITGSGAMYDYSLVYSVETYYTEPWYLFSDTIDAVVLEKGITHIGKYAFNGFAKLNKIELPSTLTSIGESAFAGCRKLYDIYSYAVEPPVAANSSFANYNVYLHVPCDNLRDYQMDAVFGSFKYIQCLGAENTTTDSDVSVTPSNNEATFVWRADGSADTYTLEIRKDGEVFCTLVFNASGQLSSIAFAPARNQVDNGQTRLAAEQTAAGFRFTVTGLSESTHYTFGLTVKDANNATLQTYTGEFNTNTTATAIDNISADTDTTPQKIIRNGQVYILRNNKTYTLTGVEVE